MLLLATLCMSCTDKKNIAIEIDPQQLNGYWEIVQAQNPYGKNVIYSINPTIDYIELRDSLGFRKKLKQSVGDNYQTSKDMEKFKVRFQNDTLKLVYHTLYSDWEEAVLRLNDSLMLIKNESDFLYTYKRVKPIEN